MNGLELARSYYNAYGRQMIVACFPEYESRIAVGLAGQGSECFGFDDGLSTDHDFGPSFCMWLTNEDYNKIGSSLQREYDRLPKSFLGFAPRMAGPQSGGRVGALSTADFYRGQIGKPNAELSLLEWFYIPESRLATVTNGEVFFDSLGEFSHIRQKLLRFYPEDVRLKKIAARVVAMGQSGQYNYPRCMCRGEWVAASHAMSSFIENTISMVFLLNRRYKPFYKWMHRAMRNLPVLGGLSELLKELALGGLPVEAWGQITQKEAASALNSSDKNVLIIERICRIVKEQLQKERLTDRDGGFLPEHGEEIMARIGDEKLRSLHIMEG